MLRIQGQASNFFPSLYTLRPVKRGPGRSDPKDSLLDPPISISFTMEKRCYFVYSLVVELFPCIFAEGYYYRREGVYMSVNMAEVGETFLVSYRNPLKVIIEENKWGFTNGSEVIETKRISSA